MMHPHTCQHTLRRLAFSLLLAVLLSAVTLILAPTSDALTTKAFAVNSTDDLPDTNTSDNTCDVDVFTPGDQCTLRGAIQESNRHPGANDIAFAIPGEGVKSIELTDQLPMLTDKTGPTTIDGYTQPGSSPNTHPLASDAKLMVEIVGAGNDQFDGLPIWSPGNVVRGLAFYDLRGSIKLTGADAHDNSITGNFIGTSASGTRSAPARVTYSASGIRLSSGASNNVIGGASPGERNVISGNATHGVGLYGDGTNGNRVVGNLIGLAPSGGASLPNRAHGVDINEAASNNVIGGASPGERNVISGNANEGVEISHGSATAGFPSANQVTGNFIGTGPSGESGPRYARNGNNGVHLQDTARANVVSGNVIGNSGESGIGIDDIRTNDNEVYGNRIGVSRGGAPLPNGKAGVHILAGAQGTHLGPRAGQAGNVIANNPVGIQIDGAATDFHTITGNSIHNNARLGIDLGPLGVRNKNDRGDADGGANQQQNPPVLASARTSGGVTTIKGVLDSMPNETFTIQYFANPKGTDEGKTLVGEKSLTTGAGGRAGFTFRPVTAIRSGRNVTATVTARDGSTSEFSAPRTVTRR